MATVMTLDGLTRYSIRCRDCGTRWIESARRSSDIGRGHHCARFDARRAHEGETRVGAIGRYTITWDMIALATLTIEPILWTSRPHATECGARCQAARGPACDCRCRGANHGAA